MRAMTFVPLNMEQCDLTKHTLGDRWKEYWKGCRWENPYKQLLDLHWNEMQLYISYICMFVCTNYCCLRLRRRFSYLKRAKYKAIFYLLKDLFTVTPLLNLQSLIEYEPTYIFYTFTVWGPQPTTLHVAATHSTQARLWQINTNCYLYSITNSEYKIIGGCWALNKLTFIVWLRIIETRRA